MARIVRRLGAPPRGVLGPGDDTALLPSGRGRLLWTTDAAIEGTHFRRDWMTPAEVGWRAVAANLSDAAAMGGRPRYLLLALELPLELRVGALDALCGGAVRAARQAGASVVGGNVAVGSRLAVTISLLGDFPRSRPRLRASARPGDVLYLTGQPGLARLGWSLLERTKPRAPRRDPWRGDLSIPQWRKRLAARGTWYGRALRRFLLPQARLGPGTSLPGPGPRGLIDVSDGLAQDGARLGRAVFEADRFPMPAGFRALCADLGLPPVETVLAGGEDYELLAAVPPGMAARLGDRCRRGGTTWSRVGGLEAGPAGSYVEENGRRRPLGTLGYRHFGA